MNQRCAAPRRIVIVGGGFAGASLAIQLVRRTDRPLDVTVVEPNPEIGRGLAYSTNDPDHRLNAPAYAHSVLPEDFLHFARWAEDRGLLARDPGALWPDGGVYHRRSDYGAYVAETFAAHADWTATGSRIFHLRDMAEDARFDGAAVTIWTQGGEAITADRIVVATGNPSPRLPKTIARPWASHPSLIENPFEPGRLKAVSPEADVLVVGAGLTALDAMSTLLAQGHTGAITAVSRHGQVPRGQAPIAPALRHGAPPPGPSGPTFLARVLGPVPDFLDAAAGIPPTGLTWLRALRRRIAEAEAAGATWHQPFDSLRDSLWRLWPSLPLSEQRRVLRRLRTFYDVHRFRTPPQNDALVALARERGQVGYAAGTVVSLGDAGLGGRLRVDLRRLGQAGVESKVVDVVVNASGLDTAAGIAANPFLRALDEAGAVGADACNLGLKVDDQGRAVGADGKVSEVLRIVGPPTLGTFGDPIGAFFIAAQIHRFLPSLLDEAGSPDHSTSTNTGLA